MILCSLNWEIADVLKLLENIAARIASLIDYIVGAAGKGIQGLLALLFGGAASRMPPMYEPTTSGEDLLGGLQKSRDQAIAASASKDCVATVYKYAKSQPLQRATVDLSALHAAVRATLLTMSDAELDVLSTAGQHAVRLFASGKPHGIFGIPVVNLNDEPMVTAAPAEPTTPEYNGAPGEREVRTRLLREMAKYGGALEFKMPIPKP